MSEQSVVKTVSYELANVNLDELRSDDPQVEGLLDEVALLLQRVRAARATRPAAAIALEMAQVPPVEALRDCIVCRYSKMVNFRIVEDTGETGERGCGDCGFRIKSHTTVVDYRLVRDEVECWDLKYPPSPQPEL